MHVISFDQRQERDRIESYRIIYRIESTNYNRLNVNYLEVVLKLSASITTIYYTLSYIILLFGII